MPQSLKITAATIDPAFLDLPWDVPLEEWPESVLAPLPRGISRHIVRFARVSGEIVAIKEISLHVAQREYNLLRSLDKMDVPSVEPLAVIGGRRSPDGEELNAALATKHLQYSLPYRAVFSQHMRPETALRLIDALAVLMVRLHLLGFYWGDVSLSNTLFLRDAGSFAAYLVDAETGELHEKLTKGQRDYDVDLARTNIIGELMDLQAGGMLAEDEDVIAIGNLIFERYHSLWEEVTGETVIAANERWRVTDRINRLNELGFEVDEISIDTDDDGDHVRLRPKVVDAGHFHRKVMRLTGLDVEENQARRMLNDLDEYRWITNQLDEPIELVAHEWLATIYTPTLQMVPKELRSRLSGPQLFHEILEHRWYMSQRQGRDVPTWEAVKSYAEDYLANQRDERVFMATTQELPKIATE